MVEKLNVFVQQNCQQVIQQLNVSSIQQYIGDGKKVLTCCYLGTIEERHVVDCRTDGCGKNAECIREQAFFVCRCLPGHTGRPEVGCQRGKKTLMLTPILNCYSQTLYTVHRLTARLMQFCIRLCVINIYFIMSAHLCVKIVHVD